MVWFKVDDRLGSSRKVLAIRRGTRLQAIGLWSLAGAWAAGEGLDGFVPDYMVEEIGGDADLAASLVGAGLWDEVDGGWQFVNWAEYQPDAASTKAKRQAESEGGARGNHTRWHERRGVIVDDCEFCKGSGTRPANDQGGDRVPDQAPDRGPDGGPDSPPNPPVPGPGPDPIPVTPSGVTGGGPRKRGTRIPESFIVTAAMREWAAGRVPLVDVDSSTERFVNHWRAKSGKDASKLDWPATWRNWLLRDQEDRAGRTKLTPTERAIQTVSAGREFAGMTLTSLELEGGIS